MIKKEAATFLAVGSITVLIDYLFYRSAIVFMDSYSLAKAIGFVSGTVFAYVANRLWTFGHISVPSTFGSLRRFISVYGINLFLNVAVNSLVLQVTGELMITFLVATAVSATSNFLGMKFIVFKSSNGIGVTP